MDPATKTIRISEEVRGRERVATLLHELLHLAFPESVVSDDVEEQIVAQIEYPLLQALEEVGLIHKKFSILRTVPLKGKKSRKGRKKKASH